MGGAADGTASDTAPGVANVAAQRRLALPPTERLLKHFAGQRAVQSAEPPAEQAAEQPSERPAEVPAEPRPAEDSG